MAILRRLYPAAKTLQPYLVDICGAVAIGSSGAVGAAKGKGFTVTRTGAGLYTITLDANVSVPDILHASAVVVNATGSTCQDAHILTISPSTKVVTLQTNASGTVNTAADPPSGSTLTFRIVVQNAQATQ